MKIYSLLTLSTLLLGISCKAQDVKAVVKTSDENTTLETKNLYKNLSQLRENGFLFGNQDALAYGVNWKYQEGRCDIKDVTGDYPGIYGWDLGGTEHKSDTDIDGVPFVKMKQWIKEIYDRGGVSTMSWHMDNPFTGKNAWDTTPNSFASILPNGSKHELYKSWLDNSVKFFLSLKGSDGKPIPILYRPFHELTGNWFWWCKNNATPEQFKEVWKFTVDYYKSKGVHNLLYVYNTSMVKSREEFLEYYPGADYADIISFDNYEYNDPTKDNSFVENNLKLFEILDQIAKEQNKLTAFAEVGYEAIPYDKFWTKTLLESIGKYKISYVLAWRNHGWQEQEKKMHYYVPYKGQVSEKDFIAFFNLNQTLFQKDVSYKLMYK
ncbi:glycosyl hydrolase [Flavobacterium sp. SUN052]|uniref:glycoside hydrolase family 26 protein n=1 Tax=Flavobacterium sp. SUN052 TaxID=3002441 RepID=UPI00237E9BE3|nr:glycosyl hydrolase [Flavobacterium sp. SUN052]MEC4005474.1 glycosyl hydrolase [Flavobacterium sp. SUN052]